RALLPANIVKVAIRPPSASTSRLSAIWATFQPPISSPIRTRVILSAEPARTTARTSSPSVTIPNSATSGGEGGGGGGSGAATTAGGGGGGRRVGENSGCSRVADRLSSGCSASGLGRAVPVSLLSSACGEGWRGGDGEASAATTGAGASTSSAATDICRTNVM